MSLCKKKTPIKMSLTAHSYHISTARSHLPFCLCCLAKRFLFLGVGRVGHYSVRLKRGAYVLLGYEQYGLYTHMSPTCTPDLHFSRNLQWLMAQIQWIHCNILPDHSDTLFPRQQNGVGLAALLDALTPAPRHVCVG